MEIFIPLFTGALEPSAIKALKDSGIITGFELDDLTSDISDINKTGFSFRYHNPQRMLGVDLADEDFLIIAEPVLTKIKNNTGSSDTVSFHLGFTRIHQPRSEAHIFKNAVFNIERVSRLLGKRILFEMPAYYQKHICAPIGEVFNHITKAHYIKSILGAADCGMVLDLSHTFITGTTKGHAAGYYEDLLSECSAGIEQIHISVPALNSRGEPEDAHGFFSEENPFNNKLLEMFSVVLDIVSGLRISTTDDEGKCKLPVTLEMIPGLQMGGAAEQLTASAIEPQTDGLASLYIRQARKILSAYHVSGKV